MSRHDKSYLKVAHFTFTVHKYYNHTTASVFEHGINQACGHYDNHNKFWMKLFIKKHLKQITDILSIWLWKPWTSAHLNEQIFYNIWNKLQISLIFYPNVYAKPWYRNIQKNTILFF